MKPDIRDTYEALTGSSSYKDACPRCGREKYKQFAVCWKCNQQDQLEAAHKAGYSAGYRDATRRGRETELDETRLSQLIQLCHPDKHNNSPLANDATAWLLEQRKR